MSVVQNFDPALNLAQLQALTDQQEPADGPIDGLSTSTLNGAAVTIITFDTAISVNNPISILAPIAAQAPAGLIPFVKGNCLISGIVENLIAYTPKDPNLLPARAVSFLQAFGWSRSQAIGIAASVKFESDFDPTAMGDGGDAYGLCQWRGSRQTDFQNLQGQAIVGSTFHQQLEFIVWELSHTEHVAGGLLRATTTVEDAAQVVCVQYERPKNPTADSIQRVAYAKQLDAAVA